MISAVVLPGSASTLIGSFGVPCTGVANQVLECFNFILTDKDYDNLDTQLFDEGLAGVRDANLFYSAINAPYQRFADEIFYPTVYERAARLCYGIVSNHPFYDGNKRTALMAMLVFLRINGICLKVSIDDLVELMLKLAKDEMKYEDLLDFLINCNKEE